LDIIDKHNKENAEAEGFTMSLNKFADMTDKEFESTLGLKEQTGDTEQVENDAQDFFNAEENDDIDILAE
jgi:hypothetical protein